MALRGDPAVSNAGRLLLRGTDVTAQVDFTPAEFNELQFVAGPDGSSQDLLVVARAGRPDGLGGLLGIVDSPAVQITASVTGSRSINAAAALRTTPGLDEADFLAVAQDASLFSGLGGARPTLTSVGNFTAEAGDAFSLRELYDAGSNAFDSVARYRVALRGDPAAGGGGRLLLRGADVTAQVDFTPADFNELQFVAGPPGSRQELLVVARKGRSDGLGGLLGIVDSPAVQIAASVTGSRSINAAAALRTTAGPDESDFVRVAQDASLFSGLGKARPALRTLVQPDDPGVPIEALAQAIGAFQSTGIRPSATAAAPALLDLNALYGNALGSSRITPANVPASDGLAALLLLLGDTAIGGSWTAGDSRDRQSFGIQAYLKAQR